MRETNRSIDSCNSCKRLRTSRLHYIHESKFLFVSRIELIRSKLSNFSTHVSGVTMAGECATSRYITVSGGGGGGGGGQCTLLPDTSTAAPAPAPALQTQTRAIRTRPAARLESSLPENPDDPDSYGCIQSDVVGRQKL